MDACMDAWVLSEIAAVVRGTASVPRGSLVLRGPRFAEGFRVYKGPETPPLLTSICNVFLSFLKSFGGPTP